MNLELKKKKSFEGKMPITLRRTETQEGAGALPWLDKEAKISSPAEAA